MSFIFLKVLLVISFVTTCFGGKLSRPYDILSLFFAHFDIDTMRNQMFPITGGQEGIGKKLVKFSAFGYLGNSTPMSNGNRNPLPNPNNPGEVYQSIQRYINDAPGIQNLISNCDNTFANPNSNIATKMAAAENLAKEITKILSTSIVKKYSIKYNDFYNKGLADGTLTGGEIKFRNFIGDIEDISIGINGPQSSIRNPSYPELLSMFNDIGDHKIFVKYFIDTSINIRIHEILTDSPFLTNIANAKGISVQSLCMEISFRQTDILNELNKITNPRSVSIILSHADVVASMSNLSTKCA